MLWDMQDDEAKRDVDQVTRCGNLTKQSRASREWRGRILRISMPRQRYKNRTHKVVMKSPSLDLSLQVPYYLSVLFSIGLYAEQR